MAETVSSHSGRSSLGRKLGIALGAFLVLLVVLHFVLTSSAFIKSMVLPRVSSALNADVTVADLSLSPFSEVTLQKLKVQTTGQEPLIIADQAHVRYDLMAILKGNITVHEVTLNAPVVNIVTEPDGKSNLDPLLKKDKPDEPQSDAALQLAVTNIKLNNGTVRLINRGKDGSNQLTELSKLNVTLDRLQNGQPGKATISSGLRMVNETITPVKSNDVLEGNIDGTFNFTMDQQLMPETVKGDARLAVSGAKGSFGDLAGLTANLQADITPKEIRSLALRFERSGTSLGNIAASGPFDLNKLEGKLNVKVQSIDRQVLNLAGAQHNIDFGNTRLNADTMVEISQNASAFAAAGQLNGQQVTVIQNNQNTPPIDLNVHYQVNVDLNKQTATVQKLDVAAQQNQRSLLSASLDAPMSVSWGTTSTGLPDSVFQLAVNQFDLKAWQALLGTNIPSGRVDVKLSVRSEQNGKLLTTKVSSSIQDLSATVGTNQIQRAQASFDLDGTIRDLKQVNLPRFQLDVAQGGRSIVKSSGSGEYNSESGDVKFQQQAELVLPDLIRLFPVPNVSAASGILSVTSTLSQAKGRKSVAGVMSLKNFSGAYEEYRFQNYQSGVDFNIGLTGDLVQIERFASTFGEGSNAGGRMELSGHYHMTNQSAQINFALADLNQNMLRPFLSPHLGEMRLDSISINGNGSASHDPKSSSAVKAQVAVANAIIEDPRLKLPTTPINAKLDVDGSLQQQVADIRKLVLSLQQGDGNDGIIDLGGKYNMSNQTAQIAFKINNINETTLRPILASSLGEAKLISIQVNGSGTGNYSPTGDSAIKADVNIGNVVIDDSKNPPASSPLSARLQLDSSLQKQVLDLRQLSLVLAPTPRANNQVQVQGRLDLNQTNASPSHLKVTAEALDLTPYYDLLAGSSTTNAPAAEPAPDRDTIPPVELKPAEPEPIALPFQQFTADLKIDRLYLRQIAVTNWQASAAINKGEVTLKPFQMTLNGAPVSATAALNLSVPGYRYDVAFNADQVPLEPVVSSFSPSSAGNSQGNLIAGAQIKGAGTTGANLQKNLSGQVNLNLTNLNFHVISPRTRRLLEPIAVALRVPELTQTPVSWVNARADIGQGKANISQLSVLSHAFLATGQGTVQIAEILTNSPLNIPVDIALRRSLAERANLVPANTPTNAAYVQLPAFAKVEGTLGAPKTEINKLALSGIVLQSVGGIPKLDDKTGNLIQGLGGILTGQRSGGTATNAQPDSTSTTNRAQNLLQGISGILSGQQAAANATNAPAATNSQPSTNRTQNLLQGISGILSGQQSTANTTNAPARTNTVPSTNRTQNLLQGIHSILGAQQSATNSTNAAPRTNSVPSTNRTQRINPLDLLLPPPSEKTNK